MWRDLRESAQNEAVLPEVQGERCVHTLFEQAACRACVEACPKDAWVIDDDMLGIDPARCDGCELCVPACPQGAIEARFSPSLKSTAQGAVAMAHCPHSGVEGIPDGLMPCPHAIGLGDLLRLYQSGAGLLVTSCGDCDRCDRGRGVRLESRVKRANRLLISRGEPPITHSRLDSAHWTRAFHRFAELASASTLDRRAFFRSAVRVPREKIEEAISDIENAYLPPGMFLPDSADDVLFPYVPSIDARKCIGCDACIRLCPHGAISLPEQDETGFVYLIDAKRCSNCGICSDVCDRDAISVQLSTTVTSNEIPLRAARCRACGASFHVPDASPDTQGLCWVCSKTNHHQRLFQVLD